MSKFDSILNSEDSYDVEFSPVEALVVMAAIAGNVDTALADDRDGSVENEFLDSIASQLEGIDGADEFDADAFRQKFVTALNESSYGALYNAAWESLPDDLAIDAFGLSALVIAVDGDVPEGATDYLAELQASLELTDDQAQAAIDEYLGDEDEEDEEEA